MDNDLFDVLSDINNIATNIYCTRHEHRIVQDCVHLAKAFEPLLTNDHTWDIEDREGIDSFLRNVLMMSYEKCAIVEVGFVASLRREDVYRRVRILQLRMLRMSWPDTTATLRQSVYNICSGLNDLCNEILYPGSVNARGKFKANPKVVLIGVSHDRH